MKKFPGSKLIAVCLTLLMTFALAADAGAAEREYPSFLPENLYAPKDLRPLLEKIWMRSPAVQKQLAAYRTADGFYETQRAIEAGRRVYSEYRDAHVPKHRAVASGTATAVFLPDQYREQ